MHIQEILTMFQYQGWDHHSVLFLTHYVCRTILNNLGRLLTEKLLIFIGDKVVYESTGESMLKIY